MIDLLPVLLGVGLAQAVAVVSPGPSLLVVARTAVGSTRVAAAWTAVGLGLGSVVWGLGALFGLKLLFAAVPWLYTAVKLAGGAYLAWLAIMLWRHARTPLATGHGGATPLGQTRRRAVRRGLFTQLANPKVAVFFGSIFVTLLPPDPPAVFYAVLVPMVFAIECGWYLIVAYALSTDRLQGAYGRLKPTLDRVAGTVLAGLSVKLVLDR
ncbi:threonine/homoserine/homoserine lactone efflux protein [Rhodothalassium salexigens DSM 2132]|uniref:Threonine/homoserine/homoserine lactone efflux protein n=1 Tax=Rhodothalassium salexigens DSM 2132 TaxID=1188247 RepID=A0A4V2SND7_RHOSA|nr:LysE family transporter [Rhodothalassium salexigens]MBB4212646.1 threonine/homoserine/homoserine lactone efflux protein [Rhodothalassium salexigens DSM 2132]TCP30756.1 threonine/homoserine/homoserine lactone efflux protein [Rhodothalassium salexigens DSM 2132]